MTVPLPERDQELLFDAIVSYSDACTLPSLTPSCPYYEETAAGPRCRDQCKDIIARLGIADRNIREVPVDGGLVMTGRPVPITAAAGHEDYDSRQKFIEERLRPVTMQSTSTLLLNVAASLRKPPLAHNVDRVIKTMELIAELERRGVPVDRVIRAGMLPSVSSVIAVFSAMPLMKAALDKYPAVSQEALGILADASEEGWAPVLRATIDHDGGPEAALETALKYGRRKPSVTPVSPEVPVLKEEEDPRYAALSVEVAGTPSLRYAMTDYFSDHVSDWLAALIDEDDLTGLIRWDAPPPSVFNALIPSHRQIDELGLWVWERFTETQIENWTTSSLIYEWKCHNETTFSPIPMRVWLERRTDPTVIAKVALQKMSLRRTGRTTPKRGLDAAWFTSAAVVKLTAGAIKEAADIFAGLVELRPADADAWNNYGFCLMPLDLEEALANLQRASLYPTEVPLVNVSNRVLALHLLGRDEAALRLGSESFSTIQAERRDGTATMWKHDDQTSLELAASVEVEEYFVQLMTHIESGVCEARAD